MSSLESFGAAFFPPVARSVSTAYGTVQSINADGSYQVKLNAIGTTRCAKLCNASVGDRVFVVIQANGHCAALGKVGGDSGAHGIPQGGTSGQVLSKASATDYDVAWVTPTGGGGVSHTYALTGADGTVKLTQDAGAEGNAGTYTLTYSDVGAAAASHTHAQSDVTGLSTALAGKSDTGHKHAASDITSGTLATARGGVPTGGTAGQVLAKASGTDNDLEWVDASGGGSTGTPTALYDDSTGTTGTVTLSASANNYTYMRIYFKKSSGQGACGSVDVHSPNGKKADLTIFEPDSSALWFASRTVYINGTSITTQASIGGQVSSSPSAGSGNEIAIYRVEAWNVIPAVYPAAVQSGSNLAVE